MKKMFDTVLIFLILALLVGCSTSFEKYLQNNDVKALKDYIYREPDVNRIEDGATLLMWASSYCNVETVKLLIEKGADVNGTDIDKQGALHWAASAGCDDVIKLLIGKGAKIDALDSRGGTPLGWAAWINNRSSMLLLLEYGANPNIANEYLLKKQEDKGIKSLELAVDVIKHRKTKIASNKYNRVTVVNTDTDEIPVINSEPRDNAYAVVIGIESYRSIPNSDYSRNDATVVKSYLKALGFQERNIDFITDEKATRTDIQKSIEARLPTLVKKGSTVFIYFSGHGAPEPSTGEAYLVPYDGDPNYLPVTGYPLKKLYESLGKLKAKEIVVVLDSCFSGSGGRSVLAKGARPLVMMAPAGILPSNLAVLSASQGNQISTSSPDKGHGIFTYYFLKAIKKGNGTLAEIYKYITPQVEDEAKQLNVQQSPSITPDLELLKGRFNLRKYK